MCCEFITKYVLFFTNLIFSLGGLGLLILGIVATTQISDILDLIPVNINLIPVFIIVIGSVIFLISFCGCCGAIRESRCLLVLYAVAMLILAALKIWLAVVVFRNLNNLQGLVEEWLNESFNKPNLNFQVLEVAFRCCGTTGPEAYGTPFVHAACCENPIDNICAIDVAFSGCNEKLGSYFETFGDIIAASLLVVIVIEVIAMLLALYLNQSITSKRRR